MAFELRYATYSRYEIDSLIGSIRRNIDKLHALEREVVNIPDEKLRNTLTDSIRNIINEYEEEKREIEFLFDDDVTIGSSDLSDSEDEEITSTTS